MNNVDQLAIAYLKNPRVFADTVNHAYPDASENVSARELCSIDYGVFHQAVDRIPDQEHLLCTARPVSDKSILMRSRHGCHILTVISSQSDVDSCMPLRMLAIREIIDKAQNPLASPDSSRPPFPVSVTMLYLGGMKYPETNCLRTFFAPMRNIPDFQFATVSPSDFIDLDLIHTKSDLPMLMLCLKYYYTGNLEKLNALTHCQYFRTIPRSTRRLLSSLIA